MIPGTVTNLAMFAAADYVFQDTIYQADGVTAQNIAGWSIRFTMHAYNDPGTVFVTKTVGSGITLSDAINGVLQISFSASDTNTMMSGQYSYAVSRYANSAATPFMSSGLFTLVQDPSRV